MGGNAASITSKAKKNSKLSGYVSKIENEIDEPFQNLLARIIGQQQQEQQPQGATQGKQAFMQGLSALAEGLKNLKNAR